jgi:hypothetical protein
MNRVRWMAYVTLALIGLGLALAGSGADAADKRASVRLPSTNGSTVRGRATVAQLDGLTTIAVSVAGGGDASYLPYVHRGTCTAYKEQPAIPLAIATSEAPSQTTVDIAIETLLNGEYVVDLHVAEGSIASLTDPTTSVACGVLQAASAATPTAVATQPPVAEAPVAGVGPLSDGQTAGVLVALAGVIAIGCMMTGLRLRRPAVYVRTRVVRRRYRGLLR